MTAASHLCILPEFRSGLAIMKYVNNHPKLFDFQKTAFGLGLFQFVFSCTFTVYNSIILWTRATVFFTMTCYTTVVILCEMPNFYYEALCEDKTNVLLEVFNDDNIPRVKNFNRTTKFANRPSLVNKVQRVCFKWCRLVFVTVIYYWVPFSFIVLHQVLLLMMNAQNRKIL